MKRLWSGCGGGREAWIGLMKRMRMLICDREDLLMPGGQLIVASWERETGIVFCMSC